MPGPDCWNEHPCGGAGGLGARGPSPAAGRIASSLHFAQSAFKKVLHDLYEFNPDFLSSKRRSIKGRAFRNAGNESVAHRGPQSPSCSGRLKKIAAISQAPETKLKLFASVPALLQGSPLDEQTMSISIAESDSKRVERFELLERIELCRRPPLLPNHCTPRRSRMFLT
jgi:hypothetical protein